MLGPHTVELVAPAGRNEWGDVQTGESVAVVPGCFWQPVSSSEQLKAADTVTVVARLFMPASTAPAATHRVRFEGREYAIEGRPALHHTPAGPHHYEIDLTDVEG